MAPRPTHSVRPVLTWQENSRCAAAAPAPRSAGSVAAGRAAGRRGSGCGKEGQEGLVGRRQPAGAAQRSVSHSCAQLKLCALGMHLWFITATSTMAKLDRGLSGSSCCSPRAASSATADTWAGGSCGGTLLVLVSSKDRTGHATCSCRAVGRAVPLLAPPSPPLLAPPSPPLPPQLRQLAVQPGCGGLAEQRWLERLQRVNACTCLVEHHRHDCLQGSMKGAWHMALACEV